MHIWFEIAFVALTSAFLLAFGGAVLVFRQYRSGRNRLRVLNSITTGIAQAQSLEPLMRAGLDDLRALVGAKTAWVQLLRGTEHQLEATVASDDGLNAELTAQLQDLAGIAAPSTEPNLIRLKDAGEAGRQLFARGYHQLFVVPVNGRNAVIGTIFLAFDEPYFTTLEEKRFLATTANQLGLAAENLQLVAQIRRSRTRWVRMFDSLPDPMFVHSPEFRIMKANRALLDKVGSDYDAVVNRTLEEILGNDAREWQDCPYCAAGEGEVIADPCFGGFALVSTSCLEERDGQPCTVHVIHDVTEHRKSEESYQLMFEQMREAVFVSTPDGKLLDCNEALVKMLGYESKDELLAVPIQQHYVSPTEREAATAIMTAQGYLRNHEMRLRRKDGTTFEVLDSSYATRDAQGNIERFQGFLLDITAKKRADEELRHRNKELFTLNAIATAASRSFDLEEVLNTALKQIISLFSADCGSVMLLDEAHLLLSRLASLGHTSDLGREFPGIKVPAELLERIKRERIEIITREHLAELPGFVTDFVKAEGLKSLMWMMLWSQDRVIGLLGISYRRERTFTEAERNLLLAAGRQIATSIERTHLYHETRKAYEDLRRTQEQLLQSEKMSAVGQLISGVAHELNNPLTAILGYAQLLEAEALNVRERDYVEKLYKQAQRTHKIVQNLLSFARQRKPEKQLVDLARVLEDTVALRDYDMRLNDIDLLMDVEPGTPQVVADAHQLEQVFLNILNNAVDAIMEHSKEGGCLRVSLFRDAASVVARIHDSGPGIKDVKRIFDPFYTTKAVGKGTGLGLSICYGIVKEHGGEIVASNHPSGGAVFEIRLPVAEEVGSASADRSKPARQVLKGRILVVDDEEAVLDFESRVLASAGAEVVCANGGNEAIALLKRETFDALIVDGKMPGGWSGPEIYCWLQEHKPVLAARMILAHSHLHDSEIGRFLQETGIQSITKPFAVADLVALVAGVLNRSVATAAKV